MAYKSEMARARGEKRAQVASERRALKHKMNQYNPLSRKARALPSDFALTLREQPQTTNDILLQLAETMGNKRETKARRTFIDKYIPAQLSPEVAEYWKQRIAKGGIKF